MNKIANLFSLRTLTLHPDFNGLESFMDSLSDRFAKNEGVVIHKGRNELRRMEYNGKQYVVKSFHKPNFINRFIYGIFRPSKAKRSYDYAALYRQIGVGTPTPVGYINQRKALLFNESYFVTCLSECTHTYGELFDKKFEYEEEVLRQVGRITAILHENGYAHKDYGRGNILFEKTAEGVKIEIVDLNRMAIGPLDIKSGCKNFERLPATPQMHRWMAEEYAAARGFDVEECVELMKKFRSKQSGKINNLY
ncbi:MAG: lipopolysaccharide kinase InaA family protein [Bacteroidales bacterium]